jgi:trk system potassium uptake protein TrkA
VQVRRTHVEAGSLLHKRRLADVDLPRGSLVLALISGSRLIVPSGDDHAQPGDEALVLGTSDVIDEVEKKISGHSRTLGTVVIAGGGSTARAVASGLERQARTIKIIEERRERAEELAAEFPQYEILHGDATDMSLLGAEGIGSARAFIALTGNDETNLMACLLAQELGAQQLTALVQKSETSSLWRKVGLLEVVSPRTIAAERIRNYINNNYEPHIVSFENGAAQFIHRRVDAHSPAAGCRLGDIEIPQGLIVAAVLRGGKAEVPDGNYQIEVDDEVVLFVREAEVSMAHLLFPGSEAE